MSSTVCRKLANMLEVEQSHRPQPHSHLGKDNILKVLPRFDHKYNILAGRKHLLSKNGSELECGCLPHFSVCSWKDPLKWLAHEPEIWEGLMVPYSMKKDKEFAALHRSSHKSDSDVFVALFPRNSWVQEVAVCGESWTQQSGGTGATRILDDETVRSWCKRAAKNLVTLAKVSLLLAYVWHVYLGT